MLRISQKIIVSFAIIASLFVSVIAVSSYEMMRVRGSVFDLSETKNKYDGAYYQALLNAQSYASGLESMLSLLDRTLLNQRNETLMGLEDVIRQNLHILSAQSDLLLDKEAQALLSDFNVLFSNRVELYHLMHNFAQMKASALYYDDVQPISAHIFDRLAEAKGLITAEIAEQRDGLDQRILRLRILMYVTLFVALVLSFLVSVWLWLGTINPLRQLTAYLNKDYALRYLFNVPFLRRPDEIGDFARAFDEIMAERDSAETLLKVQTQELSAAKDQAEAANAAKSEFLANMSHELRTPLNSILGIVQLLKAQEVDEERREMFTIIDVSSSNLLKILNDILDLSKIEAGETHLEYVAFDLSQLIAQTVDGLKPLASQKGLLLACEDHTQAQHFVLGDPLRFGRVLINLINNAIRYTEDGTIQVVVDVKDNAYAQIDVKIQVIDSGIGIPEDRLETVFEKFTQADTSTTRKYGGTGLGLTITRELVEMMGGKLGVKSILGLGSTFWFTVPFETVKELPKDAAKTALSGLPEHKLSAKTVEAVPVPLAEARILLAEDQIMNIAFMEKLFSNLGLGHYTIVNNGQEAVAALTAEDFDLVLMDCHMPVMNGYEATQAMRALPYFYKSRVPIVAMTANVMQKDIDHCFSVGMDGYIGKPFDLEAFQEKLSRWIIFDAADDATIGDSATAGTGTKSAKPAMPVQEKSPVDLHNLRKNAQGDEAFVKDMVHLFITQAADQIVRLDACCAVNDFADWIDAAHALKGIAAGVGGEELRALCEDAQNMSAPDQASAEAIIKDIKAAYHRIKTYFEVEGFCS